ncbi:MAG: hypothetical protein KME23_24665 [Goleter apudmare HA4340-LM2]|nr:hypothetical protein [Goleter apudmare HA4340-LM2]
MNFPQRREYTTVSLGSNRVKFNLAQQVQKPFKDSDRLSRVVLCCD